MAPRSRGEPSHGQSQGVPGSRGRGTEDGTGQWGPDSPGRAPRAHRLIQPHLTREETWAVWDGSVGGRAGSQRPASCPDPGCRLQAHTEQGSPGRSLVLEKGTPGGWHCPLGLSLFLFPREKELTWMAVDKISLPVFSLNTDRSCRTRSEAGWSRAFWASCTSDSRLPKGCSWSRTHLPMQEM